MDEVDEIHTKYKDFEENGWNGRVRSARLDKMNLDGDL